jgi:hypothetical protein
MRIHPQETAAGFSAQVSHRFQRESIRIVGFQEGGGMRASGKPEKYLDGLNAT